MTAASTSSAFVKRLSKPITFGELVRVVLAVVLGFVCFLVATDALSELTGESSDILNFLKALVIALVVPTAASTLFALVLPSWRYKLIGGVLLMFFIFGYEVLNIVSVVSSGFEAIVFMSIRFSVVVGSALIAVSLWRIWSDAHRRSARPMTPPPAATQSMPRTSLPLLLLSLVSIPAAYATILLSSMITIGLSALLLVLLQSLPRVPVALIVASCIAPIVAVWAAIRAIRSSLAPPIAQLPACVIDLQRHERLRVFIETICRKVGTRMPDQVLLDAEPTFFVSQGRLGTFDGTVKGRVLALGAPLLRVLNTSEVRSILAHEFAHFSGRDTLYSAVIAPVYRGVEAALPTLASSGGGLTGAIMTLLQKPALHYLIVLYGYFHSIAMILSRRRELRADWIAVHCYGKKEFSQALVTTTEMVAHFNESVERLEWGADEEFFAAYARAFTNDEAKRAEYLEAARNEPESEFSSHPSLLTRLDSLPEVEKCEPAPDARATADLKDDEARLAAAYAPLVAEVQEGIEEQATDSE